MGSDLFKVIEGPLTLLHTGNPFSEVYAHKTNKMVVHRIAPTTIFVDEAHDIPMPIQTSLLISTEGSCLLPRTEGGYVDFQDVLFLFGTTDPSRKLGSGLVAPLRSRCDTIYFVAYGLETVARIVREHMPSISMEDATLLARTAKLRPRIAISFAREVGDTPVLHYMKTNLGADERGLDETDRNILKELGSTIKVKNARQVREAELLLSMKGVGKLTLKQEANARALLETDELRPMYLNHLADRLDLTEIDDVRARVHYMETLGLVLRTPSGVILQKKSLDKQI